MELAGIDCIPGVSCFHIGGCERDGNIEIQVEREDGTGDEDDEDCKGGVLEISDLDFHWPEFDAPASIFVVGRWLEAHVLPIC